LTSSAGLHRSGSAHRRSTVAVIDLAALESNVASLRRLVAPSEVVVVVKADAYGHGAFPIATHAIAAGATAVAVALLDEAAELREQGFEGDILVLTEPPAAAMREAVDLGLQVTLYSASGVEAMSHAASAARRMTKVHLKIDTGMHRVGADPADALSLAAAITSAAHLELEGLFTHLALADKSEDPFTDVQLDRFEAVRDDLASAGIHARVLHAANSAGAIAHPRSRLDLVRVGIAAYGQLPAPALAPILARELAAGDALVPVLSLRSSVHLIGRLGAGERTSYGQHYELGADSVVATVLIGYADGLPRLLGERNGAVLIGGRRRPIAGTVTMDQIVVDLGNDDSVAVGDEVVLLGRQGDAEITAWEWAEATGTIAYEVLARLGPRVARKAL
jgi:alanine racemase